MKSLHLNPFSSLLKAFQYFLEGRIHFRKEEVGNIFITDAGQRFTVFRSARVDSAPRQPRKAGAVFIAHFHQAGLTVRQNIWFSLVPIPFYVGIPGFCSKRWMVDEASGDFAGYYEWQSVADAENYSHSFAARFMLKRSIPGSVWFKIYPIEAAPPPPAALFVPDRYEERIERELE